MKGFTRPCVLSAFFVALSFGATLHSAPFVRGDCNGDGEVAGLVTDSVFLLRFLFLGGSEPPCLDACDADDDGNVVGFVTDAIYLLGFNFLGRAAPPSPFPGCGEDLSADAIDCATYEPCGDVFAGVEITSPVARSVTNETAIDVTGTVSAGIDAVEVNGTVAVISDGSFAAVGVPLFEGSNLLIATARSAAGDIASATVSLRRDTTAPTVVFESPQDGDRLLGETIAVAGSWNDIVPGASVQTDEVLVELNGLPALVHNGRFLVADLPLAGGSNTLMVRAVDRAGNESTASIVVTREPDLPGIRILASGGNAQQAPIGSLLPEPLSVRVEDGAGVALADRAVTFQVARGDGLLGEPAENARSVTLLTDSDGSATVEFALGSRTGPGFHRVRATTPGSLTYAEFHATAGATAPVHIAVVSRPSS